MSEKPDEAVIPGLNISRMILKRSGVDIDLHSGGRGKSPTVALFFPPAE